MASNRLTWHELRKAVTEYANCSEQEAERFLNAFLESITEGLKQDKQVKIKGLGVFTLKAVAPRKSVNIATGEDIIIDGYNKLTFSAESMLKESVEKRIKQPKTEDIVEELKNDPLKKLNEQASEIVDILSELGQSPDGKEVKVAEDKPKASKKPAETKKPKTTKGKKAVKKDEAVKAAAVALPVTIKEEKKEEKKKRNWKWIWWVLGVIILAGAVGTGVYYREQIIGWWQCTRIMERPIKKKRYHDIVTSRQGHYKTIGKQSNETSSNQLNGMRESVVEWWENLIGHDEVKIAVKEIDPPSKKSDSGIKPIHTQSSSNQDPYTNLSYDNAPGIQEYYPTEIEEVVVPTAAEEPADAMPIYEEVEEEDVVALADEPRKYTKFIATEVVDKNSRLTLIAQKYYGVKDLWVFIYEANRNVINDPARVSAGQKLRIPVLDEKYMDMSNPELQKLLEELTDTYLQN